MIDESLITEYDGNNFTISKEDWVVNTDGSTQEVSVIQYKNRVTAGGAENWEPCLSAYFNDCEGCNANTCFDNITYGDVLVISLGLGSIPEYIQRNKNYTSIDVIEEDQIDYVCYSCSQSSYKGKIGFTKSNGSGLIKHILPKKTISYKDIMSINSEETYNKVMIENGYTFLENTDSIIVWGITLKKDSTYYYDEWVLYEKDNGEFKIKFNWDKNNSRNPYNIVIDKIKNNCTFYDTLKNDDWVYDYVSYSCSESTYKGKICYVTTDSISYIGHMIPQKE